MLWLKCRRGRARATREARTNQNAADPLKVPFYQVRLKQGDKWLINSLRVFVVAEKK